MIENPGFSLENTHHKLSPSSNGITFSAVGKVYYFAHDTWLCENVLPNPGDDSPSRQRRRHIQIQWPQSIIASLCTLPNTNSRQKFPPPKSSTYEDPTPHSFQFAGERSPRCHCPVMIPLHVGFDFWMLRQPSVLLIDPLATDFSAYAFSFLRNSDGYSLPLLSVTLVSELDSAFPDRTSSKPK